METTRNDTIAAVATGPGGALAVIRVSGSAAIDACDALFMPIEGGKSLSDSAGYTLHYGDIRDSDEIVDDVIVSLFRAPRSYTGENMVEISCHGSKYVQQRIMELLIGRGARYAEAGEFTVRAFLAGRIDLSQAEAVADMIASADKASHALAVNQMRGGYSNEFSILRARLLTLASLLELELDFGEEEVEFADRTQLTELITEVKTKVDTLLDSFKHGNAIKEGVAVAIAGAPNAGKSTLLNTLLKDDRAMVSEIAGTTRDVIEESITIDGIRFRFIDTAGIRATDDRLEQMGIKRTYASIDRANIVLAMVEMGASDAETQQNVESALSHIPLVADQKLYILLNKADKFSVSERDSVNSINPALPSLRGVETIPISAKTGWNIGSLIEALSHAVNAEAVYKGDPIVSNSRHYEALLNSSRSLARASDGLSSGLPADLVSQDIRESLHHLGTITGEITTDEILGTIFSKFCIGK